MSHPYGPIFDRIYQRNEWRHGSGEGSLPAATVPYRRFVQGYLRAHAIRSVVDLGCGDFQTSGLIDWDGVSYVGIDVSDECIRRNTARHAAAGRRFERFESFETLPAADLLLVKDVLQHLPNDDVAAVLSLTQYPHVIVTNCVQGPRCNQDIRPGEFRPLELGRPPFSARGAAALRYPAPLSLSVRPRFEPVSLALALLGRPRWIKEIFVIQRAIEGRAV